MSNYGILDQPDEDTLHKSRLLNVEEKPFKRITRRLFATNSLLSAPDSLLPTPPPDANSEDAEAVQKHEEEKQRLLESYRQLREDITLDFAAFEGSITRTHFLLLSNKKESERYASEMQEILSTANEVRENTAQLRSQLKEAQKTLALQKTYDELADRITSNRLLRPRDDQLVNLEKLHTEIAKLENESLEYAQTWAERREQFGRIVDEGMNLRRLIRDEKEEVERREGMEEDGEGDDGDAGGASKGKRSTASTPRSEPEILPPIPQQQQQAGTINIEDSGLAVLKGHTEKTRSGARPGTPLRQTVTISDTSKDASVADEETASEVSGGVVATPEVTMQQAPDDEAEGGEIQESTPTDKMDTT